MKLRKILSSVLVLMLALTVCASSERIDGKCKFKVNSGSAANLHDNNMNTYWAGTGKQSRALVQLPETGAGWLRVRWLKEPADYTVTEYDAQQTPLNTWTAQTDAFPCREMLYTLSESARYVSVEFAQNGQGISELDVYAGALPDTAINWESNEKCDLLLLSAHQDDEWLWFGGMIPYYEHVRGKKVQVVYMANCGRARYSEALNALAKSGSTSYPMFLGLKDERIKSMDDTIKHWGGKKNIVKLLVAAIRRYKPEVIVTHDVNGEYGHNQHKICALAIEAAIKYAKDPEKFPESAEQYGAWEVKKFYRQLEKTDVVEFDWNVSYDELGGRTPLQVAELAMNEQASQTKFFHVENHGTYDNSKFGLVMSTVGNDLFHNDLFENIVESSAEETAFGDLFGVPETADAEDVGEDTDDDTDIVF